MPLATAIAPLLQGPANQLYGLYIDGLNVGPFTPVDSVEITEAGPGDVSSMTFVIEDPTGIVPIPATGALVRHQDFTLDIPDFLGYVGDYTVQVMGIGRIITVHAVGIEAVLDWIAVPATTFIRNAAGDPATDLNHGELTFNLAWLANSGGSAADGRLGLFAPAPVSGVDPINGDATHPIGTLASPAPEIASDGHPVAAGSLRSVMEGAIKAHQLLLGVPQYDPVITVDFNRRLRVFLRSAAPDDYTDLTVTDTVGSALAAENLQWEVHPSDVPHTVYIVGSNAAGSGYVSDGSGLFGPQHVVSSTWSNSASRRDVVGAQYLASRATLVRGTFDLTDWTPTAGTIHPASSVIITDVQISLTDVYAIAEITKTFNGSGRQNWRVTFGGIRPSFVDALMRDYSTDITIATAKISGVRGH